MRNSAKSYYHESLHGVQGCPSVQSVITIRDITNNTLPLIPITIAAAIYIYIFVTPLNQPL